MPSRVWVVQRCVSARGCLEVIEPEGEYECECDIYRVFTVLSAQAANEVRVGTYIGLNNRPF